MTYAHNLRFTLHINILPLTSLTPSHTLCRFTIQTASTPFSLITFPPTTFNALPPTDRHRPSHPTTQAIFPTTRISHRSHTHSPPGATTIISNLLQQCTSMTCRLCTSHTPHATPHTVSVPPESCAAHSATSTTLTEIASPTPRHSCLVLLA